jgi:hypothetical protein
MYNPSALLVLRRYIMTKDKKAQLHPRDEVRPGSAYIRQQKPVGAGRIPMPDTEHRKVCGRVPDQPSVSPGR